MLLALPGLALAGPRLGRHPRRSGIEALADAAPLPALLRRDGVLHLAPGEPQRLALLRLRLTAAALAPHLGAAAADTDLVRHARDRLRGRLLATLGDPARRDALLGAMPPVPLLIDLPLSLLPQIAPAGAAENAGAVPALIATLAAKKPWPRASARAARPCVGLAGAWRCAGWMPPRLALLSPPGAARRPAAGPLVAGHDRPGRAPPRCAAWTRAAGADALRRDGGAGMGAVDGHHPFRRRLDR